MIAAGAARLPLALRALCASAQVGGVKDVKATPTQAEFGRGFTPRQRLAPEAVHDITNEGRGVAATQLLIRFFKP